MNWPKTRRGIPALALAAICAPWLATPVAHADGSLPARPYRYLHPPAALAGSNDVPEDGGGPIALSAGRSPRGYLFTRDGQAGIIFPADAFSVAPGVSTVQLLIKPVEIPPGLPSDFTANGNAYAISATSSGTVALRHSITVVLKWPHPPPALFEYHDGAWQRLCYSDQATFSPTSMSCPVKALGTVLAVSYATAGGNGTPVTPLSSTRWAFLNQYIPVLAALVVIVVTAILGYVVSRPDKPRRSR